MNLIKLPLLLLAICCFMSCEDDATIRPQPMDEEGPAIHNVRWINFPSVPNGPTGPIENGSNHNIPLGSCFQFTLIVEDQSEFATSEVFFLINDDPNLRRNIVRESNLTGLKETSIFSTSCAVRLSLGAGVFYDMSAGDSLHFYVNLTDTRGNPSNYSWTAELVE